MRENDCICNRVCVRVCGGGGKRERERERERESSCHSHTHTHLGSMLRLNVLVEGSYLLKVDESA